MSLAFICLCACTNHRVPELLPELVHAESLMYKFPDSALFILQSMQMPSPSDKYQNATWSLLLVQAQDKNYIDHTSDSLINVAYDYFMKEEDPQRKALVLNYEGRVNEDLGEVERATEFYLQAADEVKQSRDYRLEHLIYSNLGSIYIYRDLYELAKDAYQNSLLAANKAKDSIYISSALSNLGRVWGVLEKWDKSISTYKEAIRIAEQKGHKKGIARGLNELAAIYSQIEQSDSALICLKKALTLNKLTIKRLLPQLYLGVGETYSYIGQYDSAKFYLNQAISSTNIYTKRSVYECLYLISKAEKNYKSAIEYSEEYWDCRDSIEQINRSNIIAGIQAKYNHEKLKNEKIQLELERNHIIKWSLFASIFLLGLIAALICVYQRRLLIKERIIQKNKELLHQQIVRLQENELIIRKNEKRIQELCGEMANHSTLEESLKEQNLEINSLHIQNSDLLQENQTLQESINIYTQSLQDKDEELEDYQKLSKDNLRLRDRENFLCFQLVKQTNVLQQLRISPKFIKTEGEWEAIIDAVNVLYDNYTVRLYKQFPSLTESDIQICCLLKLHLSNSTIATLTGISPSSVTKRKQRMKEKMNIELGENQSLDMWLQEY